MTTCCVSRMVDLAVKTYQQGLGRGLKSADAWNLSTCDWVAAVKVGPKEHTSVWSTRQQ